MSGPTKVKYGSGTRATEKSWDVLQITFEFKDRAESPDEFHTIARKPDGTFMKRTNIDPEQWDIAKTEEDLRFCQHHFDQWDRLAAHKGASA